MKILMVSSEVYPYAKVGGLADVVPNLSRELDRQGHEVIILMPRYYQIDRLLLERHPAPLSIHLGDQEFWAAVYHQTMADSHVEVYFLEHEQLYGREGIYGPPSGGDFPDNATRFALLSKASFQLCRLLGWYPDIIHSHDWPSALTSTYLAHQEHSGEYLHTKSVFTIHNIGYQGRFTADLSHQLGFGMEEAEQIGLIFHEELNFLRSALVNAHSISTVSPHYAKEILSPQTGFGMEDILNRRNTVLRGILNGMDYETWNPASDQNLPYPYDAGELANKALNKNFVQQESGMEISARPPLIGMVSRLVDQKGFDTLLGSEGVNLNRICRELDLQMIILGTGDPAIEESLRRAANHHSNLRVYLRYNEKMSHIIQAASDFFLMPSHYEPCGLTQMYALRYGSVPVVSRTGGLVDTVVDIDEDPSEGTGILIGSPMSEDALFEALKRSVQLWQQQRSSYEATQRRGMHLRFDWKHSADAYVAMYSQS